IEGAMGLFDGRSGVGESGSSAELAQALQVPVFLVVDAAGMSGSIVPLVSGFCAYAEKMGVKIAGIIANRLGSAHHASLLKAVLQEHQQPPLIAWMAKDAPELPERHLGLVQPSEAALPDFLPFFHVEVADLLALFAEADTYLTEQNPAQLLKGKKIAIAQDAACCFIYPANLDFLREQDAELLFFSPVAGDAIPEGADTLWLPGGYPELFAEALSVSNTWPSLREFIAADKPVLAECGGAMLLGEALIDLDGKAWPMANIFTFRSKMQHRLASLGYREDVSGIKGHEFHHSVRESEQELDSWLQTGRGDQGVRYQNCRASYVHWYFASAPEVINKWLSGN
ncbi:MAG: cobyrinate a,c-diamide synthase, partial [Methylococcaceae bacterium]|nr:cobyrinate a,c-diamide synthase [Methylococcaceae bacterium]